MAPDGVIKGAGGGDGGLFNGILARYLALVVTTLPQQDAEDAAARDTARNDRAQVRAVGVGLPPERRRPAAVRTVLGPQRRDARRRAARTPSSSRAPSTRPEIPERDLSVQLSGWMLMEAAHATAASGDDGTADE